MKNRIITALTFFILLSALLSGCSKGAGKSFNANWTGFSEDSFQTSGPVSLAFAAPQVTVGQTAPLTIILKNTNGQALSGNIVLKSSQPGIFLASLDAGVSANNSINNVAIAEENYGFRQIYYAPLNITGLHTITATYEGHTSTTSITAVTTTETGYQITLKPANTNIKTGEETILQIAVADQYGNPLPNEQKVLIKSSMNNEIKVDDTAASSFTLNEGRANLVYTAGLIAGTDKLQAFVGEASASVDITIEDAPLYNLEIVPLATNVKLNSKTQVYAKIKSRLGKAVDPGQDIVISVTKGKIEDPDDSSNELSSLILNTVTSEQSFIYIAKQTGTETISATSVNATAVEKELEVTN